VIKLLFRPDYLDSFHLLEHKNGKAGNLKIIP